MDLSSPRFGLGGASRRVEDDALVRGRGCYTADVSRPDQLTAFFLRSEHAHAVLKSVSTENARAANGVRLVWTAQDMRGYGPIPVVARAAHLEGTSFNEQGTPLICSDRVRSVGDIVAMVVADTPEQAQEAASLIEVEYEPLASNTSAGRALDPDAAIIWPQFGTNLAFRSELGDKARTDAAFASASRIARAKIVHNRLVSNYLEPRAALAEYDMDSHRWTLTLPSQGVHFMQQVIATAMGVEPDRLRVITPDVGGGFGPKYFAYPDYPLVALAARTLSLPVKWVASRMEHFVSDAHARDGVVDAELAMDDEGRVLGLRVAWTSSMGAYMSQYGSFIPWLGSTMTPGVYDIPATYVSVQGVYTNNTPTDAYRGAGRPEAALTIERIMDEGARVCGLSPVEFRLRNFIRPEQMPYQTPTLQNYDSGDFGPQLNQALALAGLSGFPARREESRLRGMLRGIGFATYIEACAFPGSEPAHLSLEKDGKVLLKIGTQSSGQGHRTVYGQFIAEALGIEHDAIVVRQGDTNDLAAGGGTAGSRSIPLGIPSVKRASASLASKIRAEAATLLETAEGTIDLGEGFARVRNTNRSLSFAELVARVDDPEKLRATGVFEQAAATYPNGTHVCELEIDPDTGTVTLLSFVVVDDFGVVVNPLLLEGQIHGGIAQGVGQALLESAVYDDDTGQLLSASFMDYAMPRASDIPPIMLATHNVPCTRNEMGIKGGGEAGAIGATPAVLNAVIDALHCRYGIDSFELPATPERVWRAIHEAQR